MFKYHFLISIYLICSNMYASNIDSIWTAEGSAYFQNYTKITKLLIDNSDSSILVLSQRETPFNQKELDYTSLMKVRKDGIVLWEKEIRDTMHLLPVDMITTSKGNILIFVSTGEYSPFGLWRTRSLFIYELNKQGKTLKLITELNKGTGERYLKVLVDNSHYLLISTISNQLLITKINKNLELLSKKTIYGINADDIIQVDDSNFVATGTFTFFRGIGASITKFNKDFTKIWEKPILPFEDSPSENSLTNITELPDNNLIVLGYERLDDTKYILRKISNNGKWKWFKYFKSNFVDNVIIENKLWYLGYAQSKFYLQNINYETGEIYERITFNYASRLYPKKIITDGKYLYIGCDKPTKTEGSIPFLVKIKNPKIISIINKEFQIQYKLYQNYPNPFNPKTNISFSLPTGSNVSMRIYDVQGRLVKELINEYKLSGVHEVIFDGSNISSGVYFCRFKAGSYISTKKIVLVK